MTDFRNDQGTGTVLADSATIATVTGNLVGNVTGSVSGGSTAGAVAATTLSVSGFYSPAAQQIAAAGATQGAATAITKSFVLITTCTASARGIKLPTAVTNLMVQIISGCTQGTKVYPFAGDKIKTSATNAAVVQAGFKGEIYHAKDATTWLTFVGA